MKTTALLSAPARAFSAETVSCWETPKGSVTLLPFITNFGLWVRLFKLTGRLLDAASKAGIALPLVKGIIEPVGALSAGTCEAAEPLARSSASASLAVVHGDSLAAYMVLFMFHPFFLFLFG
jgi:hypothetical protein